jgi:hypothetical protein
MKTEAVSGHMVTTIIRKAREKHGVSSDILTLNTKAKSLEDLADVASKYIKSIGGPFAIVIGQNHDTSDRAYDWLSTQGLQAFYHLAFQIDIERVGEEVYANRYNDFLRDLLHIFYKLIMEHPNLKRVLLMPGWDKYHEVIERFNISSRRKSPPEFIDIAKMLPDVVVIDKKLYISDI